MKILQLVSDWKWTGPAEPMLVLMDALRHRGHQVDLVCPEPPLDSNRSLWQEASKRGLDPIGRIEAMRGSVSPGDSARVASLRRWLASTDLAGPYDIVHCWHSRDHVLAARALRLGWPTAPPSRRASLVRFLSGSERIAAWPWNRWLFGPGCDGLVCVNEAAVRSNEGLRGGRPIAATSGAVDLKVLERGRDRNSIRADLGVPSDAKLVGVVARMQAHRRFDLLLEALRQIVVDKPDVHLLVLGRGSRIEQVVSEPARRLGVGANLVLAGYRVDDYADVLGALDLFTYLVPGSDGTCRALLQAAALGLPMIGTDRGAIPEIIRHGETGLIVAEDPRAIAAAWSALFDDANRRARMGEAARRDAQQRFHPDRFATWMERFYAETRARSSVLCAQQPAR